MTNRGRSRQRSSYSLRPQSRTLLAEIDLPNPDDLLRPGMYAYADIRAERGDVLSLPASAVTTQGDVNEGYQEYCLVLENGKIRRMFIEVGARGEGRVQVLKKQVRGGWEAFGGEERVVLGDLSALADGQVVHLVGNQDGPSPLTAPGYLGLATDDLPRSSTPSTVAQGLQRGR
jgi:hypothetical protein